MKTLIQLWRRADRLLLEALNFLEELNLARLSELCYPSVPLEMTRTQNVPGNLTF